MAGHADHAYVVREVLPAELCPDAALRGMVRELRDSGERVVYLLSDEPAAGMKERCDRVLKQRAGEWVVEELTD